MSKGEAAYYVLQFFFLFLFSAVLVVGLHVLGSQGW